MKQLSDNVRQLQTDNMTNENEKVNPMKAKLANKLNSKNIHDLEKQRDQVLVKENILLEEV